MVAYPPHRTRPAVLAARQQEKRSSSVVKAGSALRKKQGCPAAPRSSSVLFFTPLARPCLPPHGCSFFVF